MVQWIGVVLHARRAAGRVGGAYGGAAAAYNEGGPKKGTPKNPYEKSSSSHNIDLKGWNSQAHRESPGQVGSGRRAAGWLGGHSCHILDTKGYQKIYAGYFPPTVYCFLGGRALLHRRLPGEVGTNRVVTEVPRSPLMNS